jgi:hypothetical protein
VGTGAGNETGEYIMTVSEKGHEGTLDFRHAHREVRVRVKNFSDGEGGHTPIVQLTDLPHGLTFGGMKPIVDGDRVHIEVTSVMGEDGWAVADFETFIFDMENQETDIHLINPVTGAVVDPASLHLHDAVNPDDYDPDSPDPEERNIQVDIEFLGDTEVKVTIPAWESVPVDYGTK